MMLECTFKKTIIEHVLTMELKEKKVVSLF